VKGRTCADNSSNSAVNDDEDNVVPIRDPKPARERLRKYDEDLRDFLCDLDEIIHKRWVHIPHPWYYSVVSKLGNT